MKEMQTGRMLNPPRCSKIKEILTRRVLNPPRHVEMAETQRGRVPTSPSLRNENEEGVEPSSSCGFDRNANEEG
jgi:hypothetical protein